MPNNAVQDLIEKIRPHVGDHKVEVRPSGAEPEFMTEREFLKAPSIYVHVHTKGTWTGKPADVVKAIQDKYPLEA